MNSWSLNFGFEIVKHDRSSGEVLHRSYFEREGEFMSITGQSPIYQEEDKLVFHCDGVDLYEFEYDLSSNQISIRDSFINPEPDVAGFFLIDAQLFGDTLISSLTVPFDNEESYKPGLVIRYPDGNKEVKLFELSDTISSIRQIRKLSSGKYILASRKAGPMFYYDTTIGINILDENFDIISHFSTQKTDHLSKIDDLYLANDSTLFLMARKFRWDNISGTNAFEHVLLRYNINTEEI